MLTIGELTALISAIKSAVGLFDKIAGQIKSVLIPGRNKEAEAENDRWKMKVGARDNNLVVNSDGRTIQTVTGDELAKRLQKQDLALIRTLEKKMQEHFDLWRRVYDAKDASQDPLVNAKTEAQLKKLVANMRDELMGILEFLEYIGIRLDDHYMNIRHLVQSADKH